VDALFGNAIQSDQCPSNFERLWRVVDSATYDLLVLGIGAMPCDEVVTLN
jgi:hypothetical protein